MTRTLFVNEQYLYFKRNKQHLIKRIDEAPRKLSYTPLPAVSKNTTKYTKGSKQNRRSNKTTPILVTYTIPKKLRESEQSKEQRPGQRTSNKQEEQRSGQKTSEKQETTQQRSRERTSEKQQTTQQRSRERTSEKQQTTQQPSGESTREKQQTTQQRSGERTSEKQKTIRVSAKT